MTYNSVGSNSFKTVKYNFNADNSDGQSSVGFGNRVKISLQPLSEQSLPANNKNDLQKSKEAELKSEKQPEKQLGKKDTGIDKSSLAEISSVSTKKITPTLEEMPEVSFVPQPWSRDLILLENKKPALSKTYYFNYEGKNFAGIVTDNIGKIYIYDRSGDFHRPLKHLQRYGDAYSVYHAGFREEKNNHQLNNHYIDLGTLEVLQVALQSSASGKYNVEIHKDDSFMTNWMRATSPNEPEKIRYWNDNVIKLNPKYRKNIFSVLTPFLIGSAFIIPTTLLGVSLANNGDLTPNNHDYNNPNLTDAGKITLASIGGTIGGGLAGYGVSHLKNNHKNNMTPNGNINLIDQ